MASAYDRYNYKKYWSERNYEHLSEVIALKHFLSKIPHKTKVADVGCGFGRLTPYYLRKASKIFLIDSSKKMLVQAERNYNNSTKLKFIHSRIEDLKDKIRPGSVGLVVLVRVVHHIDNPEEVIEKVSQLLKKRGYLIIEFANKLHWKAMFQNIMKGDLTFPLDIFPQDRRCPANKKRNTLPFLNFHPDIIKQILDKYNFKIVDELSVSNIRSTVAKKYLPLPFLLFLEKKLQKPLAKICFGPSIFILAQKN